MPDSEVRTHHKELKETRYSLFLCRGTKNFAVEMSEDTVTWTRLTQGMLNQYYWYTPCDQIPLVDFTTVDWVVGRYLKFIGIDHYAYSGGIQHLNWIYHA